MASTFLRADENGRSETFVPTLGHYINLSRAPYCLPPPIALLEDGSTGRPDHRMGLWELHSDLPLVSGGECSLVNEARSLEAADE